MNQNKHGILIAVEGVDGSGKSTLCQQLASMLSAHARVLCTKEPGGTSLGSQLRAIVQNTIARCAKTEFLLFAADRAQHFHEKVMPALHDNMIVISDRMADSSLVYQGYGRGLDRTMITQINAWAMDNRMPDITVYVQIPLSVAQERVMQRNKALTSFEQEDIDFRKKLIDGFNDLYKDRNDVIFIDGNQSIDSVRNDAYKKIMQYLKNKQYL